jgi:hypothetical protein
MGDVAVRRIGHDQVDDFKLVGTKVAPSPSATVAGTLGELRSLWNGPDACYPCPT